MAVHLNINVRMSTTVLRLVFKVNEQAREDKVKPCEHGRQFASLHPLDRRSGEFHARL